VSLFSVDPFLDRRYAPLTYDCLHFTREVWLAATGEDIGERLGSLLGRGTGRKLCGGHRRAFQRLTAPEDPCIALMRRPRSSPHIGVYLRGRVLHIWERGVEFMPPAVAGRGFSSVSFYR
jgi:hypothetical protein